MVAGEPGMRRSMYFWQSTPAFMATIGSFTYKLEVKRFLQAARAPKFTRDDSKPNHR